MYCCVKSCKNRTVKNPANVSFHRFPKADWKKLKWMEILKLDDVTPWSLVCSSHFQKIDFISNTTGTKRLFPSAMPFLAKQFVEPQNEEPTCSKYTRETIFLVDNDAVEQNQSNVSADMEPTVEESQEEEVEVDMQILRSTSNQSIHKNRVRLGVPKHKRKMTLKRALCSSDDPSSSSNVSPEKNQFKEELETLRQSVVKSKRKVKTLCEKLRRKTKKLESLNKIVLDLKKNNLITETSDIFDSIGTMNEELFQMKFSKAKGNPVDKQYQPILRSFALKLNTISPEAYEFVREYFGNCLPHPQTLSEW